MYAWVWNNCMGILYIKCVNALYAIQCVCIILNYRICNTVWNKRWAANFKTEKVIHFIPCHTWPDMTDGRGTSGIHWCLSMFFLWFVVVRQDYTLHARWCSLVTIRNSFCPVYVLNVFVILPYSWYQILYIFGGVVSNGRCSTRPSMTVPSFLSVPGLIVTVFIANRHRSWNSYMPLIKCYNLITIHLQPNDFFMTHCITHSLMHSSLIFFTFSFLFIASKISFVWPKRKRPGDTHTVRTRERYARLIHLIHTFSEHHCPFEVTHFSDLQTPFNTMPHSMRTWQAYITG